MDHLNIQSEHLWVVRICNRGTSIFHYLCIFFFLKPCHKFIDNFQLPFLELTRPALERVSLRSPSTTVTFPMPSKSSAVASVSSPTLQKKQSHTKSKSHSTMNRSQVRQLATKSLALFPIHSRVFLFRLTLPLPCNGWFK